MKRKAMPGPNDAGKKKLDQTFPSNVVTWVVTLRSWGNRVVTTGSARYLFVAFGPNTIPTPGERRHHNDLTISPPVWQYFCKLAAKVGKREEGLCVLLPLDMDFAGCHFLQIEQFNLTFVQISGTSLNVEPRKGTLAYTIINAHTRLPCQKPLKKILLLRRQHFRLCQVEEVVAGTNTGMSLALAGYYHYWEKCIFNAITKCIISSMATFLALLQSKDRPPLCEVKANLNGKDLVVTPTVNDIYKYLTKSVKNIVESARMFVRWMHGTCCQTAPQVRS